MDRNHFFIYGQFLEIVRQQIIFAHRSQYFHSSVCKKKNENLIYVYRMGERKLYILNFLFNTQLLIEHKEFRKTGKCLLFAGRKLNSNKLHNEKKRKN